MYSNVPEAKAALAAIFRHSFPNQTAEAIAETCKSFIQSVDPNASSFLSAKRIQLMLNEKTLLSDQEAALFRFLANQMVDPPLRHPGDRPITESDVYSLRIKHWYQVFMSTVDPAIEVAPPPSADNNNAGTDLLNGNSGTGIDPMSPPAGTNPSDT